MLNPKIAWNKISSGLEYCAGRYLNIHRPPFIEPNLELLDSILCMPLKYVKVCDALFAKKGPRHGTVKPGSVSRLSEEKNHGYGSTYFHISPKRYQLIPSTKKYILYLPSELNTPVPRNDFIWK